MFVLACRCLAVAASIVGCSTSNAVPVATGSLPSVPQANVGKSTRTFTVSPGELNFTMNAVLRVSRSGVVDYVRGRFVGRTTTLTLNAVATAVAKATLTVQDDRGVTRTVPMTVTRCFIIAP